MHDQSSLPAGAVEPGGAAHISPEPKDDRQENRQARQDWEQTFDAVPDLMTIIDAQYTIRRVNRAMAERCGLRPEELIGRKCHEVMHASPDAAGVCPHVMMMRDGCGHTEQVEEKRLNGIFEVTVSPIYDAEGRLTSCVHIARDITARKRSEAYRSMGQDILRALNEEGDQKEAIQKVIGLVKTATGVDAVGIRLQDEDDFPYFYQEGFSREFLHKENSLLARTRDGGICRDECGEVCLECTCGLVITGKTDAADTGFTKGGSCWTNDSFPVLHVPAAEDPRDNPRNECIHQGFASIALIPIRAKGRIVGLLQLNDHRKGCFTLEAIETLEGIAENIGEAMLRKQAEEKLVASERFLRTLNDQLPGMVSYWTDELRCRFANRAYLEWFGKGPEEMMGIALQDLMGETEFCKYEPRIRGVLRGEPQHFERPLVKPNGETGYTWTHYIPDLVEGKAQGFFVLVSDFTELKRTEAEKANLEAQLQQAQKMESVGRLAGGVAHDFNNLLTVILGYTQMGITELGPAHPLQANLEEIRKAAQKSADLTQQLLAFARKQTIAPKVLNVNEAVENTLKMLRRLIGEDINLAWKPAAGLWPVRVDPSQIDQILANLCVNARDAIADVGRITIETGNRFFDREYCATHVGFIPGEYVALAVSDDGCGMDKETLTHIFEPFFTTKGGGQGTGLGLATVYGIVRQNNGFITIYSEPGHGTTLRIYLPRHEGGVGRSRWKVLRSRSPGGRRPFCWSRTIRAF
ncbi:PAS domain-containing protein [Geobacter sp. FeAm09]|uniref:PAS domain-containing protein n=1 Tax=Geobacter sp. FeAm09 TaxID=2597769 RepID=UPI00197A8CC0|nr:PAS domain-containing protein [Geobacter sp. FeAm09]